jgi:hypothetical protein
MLMELELAFNPSLALGWLTKSGIQSKEGAFYAWYRTGSDEYSFLYPEITAYAIQLLCKVPFSVNPCFLIQAVKAGNWLVANQNRDGSFFCKQHPSEKDESFYVFDGGIICSALLCLYKVTGDKKYLKSALKTLTLLSSLQKADGSFEAGRTPSGEVINNPHWSQTSSCHHLKLLIPFLQAYQATFQDKYLVSSKKLLDWGLELQLSEGRFVEYLGSDLTYTHAHCYALEGLLAYSSFLGINDYSVHRRIQMATDWLLEVQGSDGGFYNWNSPQPNRIKVSDSTSQALRIYLLANRQGILTQTDLYDHIYRGFAFLNKLQMHEESNLRIYGGVSYGETNGANLGDVCACSTIFAAHATLLQNAYPDKLSLNEFI